MSLPKKKTDSISKYGINSKKIVLSHEEDESAKEEDRLYPRGWVIPRR
jgi:hypothetical protein